MLELSAYFADPSEREAKLSELDSALSSYFEDFGRRGDVVFVVESDSSMVGAAWTRLFGDPMPGHGFVAADVPELGIALKEPYRNHGIGSALITTLLEEVRRLGYSRVSLGVDRRNPAFKLYTRLGFNIHSERNNAVIMVRDLT
jgi:ribosomal protein S18 acetylase RimI-like enzyme